MKVAIILVIILIGSGILTYFYMKKRMVTITSIDNLKKTITLENDGNKFTISNDGNALTINGTSYLFDGKNFIAKRGDNSIIVQTPFENLKTGNV